MANPQSLESLAKLKGPLTTSTILVSLIRSSAGVPASVPRGKVVDLVIGEMQAAKNIMNGLNPQSEQNKQTQDTIFQGIGRTSQALTLLENAGTKPAYDMKTELQQTFVPLRAEVNDCAKSREELIASVATFMTERNKLIKKMMERFESNPSAETSTLVNELQRQQSLFVKRIEALNSKEETLAKKLDLLGDKAVRTTKALTNIDIQVGPSETPQLH